MKRAILFLFFLVLAIWPSRVLAIEDPTALPNNKFGIHILFPSELETAAKLVNSNSGDWGYVTIPIQSTDRNLEKWQKFMDECRRLHIIPIVRIATYPQSNFWTRPTIFDHLDFANFLGSLTWPVQNRYVIVYNEPNSNLEWGGSVDASHYAQELFYTIDAFKRVSSDFFIISAGLDSHAPNSGDSYKNSYAFLREMNRAVPGIFSRIDGFASHSYPNRDFTASPMQEVGGGVSAYRDEMQFLAQYGRNRIPIFITETGWRHNVVSEETAAQFYQYTFENIWKEDTLIAITPFLLNGNASVFSGFSLMKEDGTPSKIFETIALLPKMKGEPHVLSERTVKGIADPPQEVKNLQGISLAAPTVEVSEPLRAVLKWFLRM